jgi:hypothetical protein
VRPTRQRLIKNPSVMRHGYRYILRERSRYGDLAHYRYAEPVNYADGATLGDCWIVDTQGHRHPGYNVCPVPFHASALRDGRLIEETS